MFFCEWFFSVTDYLILKVIESKRVAHDQLCLCLISPFRFESYGKVSDAVTFDRERSTVGWVYDKIVPVLTVIRGPSYLNIPISFSVVDYRQILSHLTSGRNVHL